MNIVILDDYQDAVRKLQCASKLDPYTAKVYTNTVKGLGQLSVRLKDADVIVLIRERTHLNRQLIEKLPRLKLIAQTGKVGSHIDVAACSERGIAVAEGIGSPVAPAELTWALIMAAMPGRPRFRPAMRASGSISSAREVLTSRDVGFMRDRSSRDTMPRVSSVSRSCRVMMSHCSKNSARLDAAWYPSLSARAREASRPQTRTFIPKARP